MKGDIAIGLAVLPGLAELSKLDCTVNLVLSLFWKWAFYILNKILNFIPLVLFSPNK